MDNDFNPDFRANIDAIHNATSPRWWWLSFADPERPQGEQFLGVAIVQGDDPMEAMTSAWLYGCNPGGEIAIAPIPSEHVPGPIYRNRLLSRAEAETL